MELRFFTGVGSALKPAYFGIVLACGIERRGEPRILEHLGPEARLNFVFSDLANQPRHSSSVKSLFNLRKLWNLLRG